MTAAAITEPTATSASFKRAEIDMDGYLLSTTRRWPPPIEPPSLRAPRTAAHQRRPDDRTDREQRELDARGSQHASHLPPLSTAGSRYHISAYFCCQRWRSVLTPTCPRGMIWPWPRTTRP